MNENSLPKTPVISEWLMNASQRLVRVHIPSSRLDAELILAHTLHKSRTYLHAHNDESIGRRHYEIAEARLLLRLDRTPIAYIIGHKEFYGRQFRVTPATLIPRPESEDIIAIAKEIAAQKPIDSIIDVGTGSGCLGITLKLEIPLASVTLLDVSHHALMVAKNNAKHLLADVSIKKSNLLINYPFHADLVVANLPYVDRNWNVSPETDHEPSLALYAEDSGLELINKLIIQTASRLTPSGAILLEADPRQHTTIIAHAKNHGLQHIETRGFIIHLQKT